MRLQYMKPSKSSKAECGSVRSDNVKLSAEESALTNLVTSSEAPTWMDFLLVLTGAQHERPFRNIS